MKRSRRDVSLRISGSEEASAVTPSVAPDEVDAYNDFIDDLTLFHEKLGTKLFPVWSNNKRVNLHRLYTLVREHGGFDKVTADRQWKRLSESTVFSELPSSASYIMKKTFDQFLYDYEQNRVYGVEVARPQLAAAAEDASVLGEDDLDGEEGRKRRRSSRMSTSVPKPSMKEIESDEDVDRFDDGEEYNDDDDDGDEIYLPDYQAPPPSSRKQASHDHQHALMQQQQQQQQQQRMQQTPSMQQLQHQHQHQHHQQQQQQQQQQRMQQQQQQLHHQQQQQQPHMHHMHHQQHPYHPHQLHPHLSHQTQQSQQHMQQQAQQLRHLEPMRAGPGMPTPSSSNMSLPPLNQNMNMPPVALNGAHGYDPMLHSVQQKGVSQSRMHLLPAMNGAGVVSQGLGLNPNVKMNMNNSLSSMPSGMGGMNMPMGMTSHNKGLPPLISMNTGANAMGMGLNSLGMGGQGADMFGFLNGNPMAMSGAPKMNVGNSNLNGLSMSALGSAPVSTFPSAFPMGAGRVPTPPVSMGNFGNVNLSTVPSTTLLPSASIPSSTSNLPYGAPSLPTPHTKKDIERQIFDKKRQLTALDSDIRILEDMLLNTA